MQQVKAEELRIGNIVAAEVNLPALSEHTVTAQDIFDISRGAAQTYPIAISEEWLKRLGFSPVTDRPFRDYKAWIHGKDAFRLIWTKDNVFKPLGSDTYLWLTRDNIKHVHQFQNLYFALTGEELTVGA